MAAFLIGVAGGVLLLFIVLLGLYLILRGEPEDF